MSFVVLGRELIFNEEGWWNALGSAKSNEAALSKVPSVTEIVCKLELILVVNLLNPIHDDRRPYYYSLEKLSVC